MSETERDLNVARPLKGWILYEGRMRFLCSMGAILGKR
jgi:hypothetical protein